MERSPFSQSENSENNGSNKDKKSERYRVAPVRLPGIAETRPTPPSVERPRTAVPLEGIISWRESRDDEIRHNVLRQDEGTKEQKDEDQEDDDSKTHERKSHARYEPERPIHVPRPVAEIIAEQQRLHAAQEAEIVEPKEDSEDDEESDKKSAQSPLSAPDFRVNTDRADTAPEHDDQHKKEFDDKAEPARTPEPSFIPASKLETFTDATPRVDQQPAQQAETIQLQHEDDEENESVPAAALHQSTPMHGAQAVEAQPQPVVNPEDADSDSDQQSQAQNQANGQQQYAYLPPQPGQVNGAHNPNQNQQPYINPNNQNFPINPAAWNQVPVTPNAMPGAAGNGNGANNNLPPTNPNQFGGGNPMQPGGYNQTPFNPNNPAFGYGQVPHQTQSMNMAPTMPIEHPMPTSNRDPRVGPIAALLGLEYFARKRADRKLEKRMRQEADDRQRQQEQQMQANDMRMQGQQRQFEAEQRRQANQLRDLNQSQQEFTAQATYGNQQPGLPSPFNAASNPQPMGVAAEYTPAAPFGAPMRNESMPQTAPGQRAMTPNMPPQIQREGVQAEQNDQQQQPGQEYDPRKAHIEQSSWHNIVVDEHGREIAGAMQYGEGFKREQKEIIPSQTGDSDASVSTHSLPGGGGSAGSAGSGGATFSAGPGQQVVYDQYGRPVQVQSLPSGMTNPTLPAGQPTHADPQHQLQSVNPHQSNLTNPWFWIMVLLIIAAFFTAALI